MARIVPLSRGYQAVVDDEDYERVMRHTWHVIIIPGHTCKYARTGIRRPDGTLWRPALHRFILGTPDGIQVDHINGDGLDCQRANMREATGLQNSRNRRRSSNNTSGFIGVCHRPQATTPKKYTATIWHEGKNLHLGYFATASEAAHAYDAMALVLRGQFAHINFPPKSMSDLDIARRQDQPCPECHGEGGAYYNGIVDPKFWSYCPYCDGTGEIDHGCAPDAKEPCSACRGLGYDSDVRAALAAT